MIIKQRRKYKMRKLLVLVAMTVLSGCSLVGAQGSPQQVQEARAIHTFVSSIGPVGGRLAAARAGYQPRLFGHNPFFGRQ